MNYDEFKEYCTGRKCSECRLLDACSECRLLDACTKIRHKIFDVKGPINFTKEIHKELLPFFRKQKLEKLLS